QRFPTDGTTSTETFAGLRRWRLRIGSDVELKPQPALVRRQATLWHPIQDTVAAAILAADCDPVAEEQRTVVIADHSPLKAFVVRAELIEEQIDVRILALSLSRLGLIRLLLVLGDIEIRGAVLIVD